MIVIAACVYFWQKRLESEQISYFFSQKHISAMITLVSRESTMLHFKQTIPYIAFIEEEHLGKVSTKNNDVSSYKM